MSISTTSVSGSRVRSYLVIDQLMTSSGGVGVRWGLPSYRRQDVAIHDGASRHPRSAGRYLGPSPAFGPGLFRVAP